MKALECLQHYIFFSDGQSQITLVSVVVSGRNSNSLKPLCMSLLPAINKKVEELRESVHNIFPHHKSIGIFLGAQGQLSLQSMVGSGRISNSSKTLWLSSLPANMKKI